ncbi:MAG: glycosyltransferase family 1 protein [Patescibacteria group bacterium]
MKIGIDISQSAYRGSGVGHFTEGLIKAICQYDKQNEWIFFFSSLRTKINPVLKNLITDRNFRLVEKRFPPRLLSFLWNRLHVLPIELFCGKLDWFISSDWTEPPSQAQKTTIVHDLAFLRYPSTVAPIILNTQKHRLNRVGRESKVIFVDSEATGSDLITKLGIDKNRVCVNYPGVNIPLSTVKPNEVKTKYKIEKPYILTVGKIEPRKNIRRLIDAFHELNNESYELVIAGMHGWGNKIDTSKNVRPLGYVSDADLGALYRGAEFFIYPSIWEGFGYPVVEAMSCGVAVATSNTSSLAEIGGDSVLQFNPFEVNEIKHALNELIQNKDLRKSLAEKGLNRSKKFTWKNYYDTMIKKLQATSYKL